MLEFGRSDIDPDQKDRWGWPQEAGFTARSHDRIAGQQSDLSQCGLGACAQIRDMWQAIANAPFGIDLELAVIDTDGPHALVFPCRRIVGGWMNTETMERLDVRPTHWREWTVARQA